MNNNYHIEAELVSFRNLVPEITETTYLTHNLFYYPAKFIPQVVRFCINNYSKKNDWILDPFGGSATVGLESFLTNRNVCLTDLNYLVNHIVPLKILSIQNDINISELTNRLNLFNLEANFIPDWSNISYWYDENILNTLCSYWGWIKTQPQDIYTRIFEAALLPLSKYYSHTEHKAPKLFKSVSKKELINKIILTDWKTELSNKFRKNSFDIFNKIKSLQREIGKNENKIHFKGGIDASNFNYLDFQEEIQAIITSPPYLQAQEYIRTFKMDLYWLGYSEVQIKELSKLEIPYRKATRILETESLNLVRSRLDNNKLVKVLDSYFDHTFSALENSIKSLKKGGYLALFVGNPKIDGIEVETWRIAMEYFSDRGLFFSKVYEDRIKTRQLFLKRNNKNPEGMKSEFLLVMQK